MWIVVQRQPFEDMAYWPGRRWLAAADAIVWPALWVMLILHASVPVGIVGPVVAALAVVFGLGRLQRAL